MITLKKKEESGKSYFFCRVEWKKGRQCTYKVQTKKGNTTNICAKNSDITARAKAN